MLVDNGADVNIADKLRGQWLQAYSEYDFSNTILMANINTAEKGVLRHKQLIYFTRNFFRCCILYYI